MYYINAVYNISRPYVNYLWPVNQYIKMVEWHDTDYWDNITSLGCQTLTSKEDKTQVCAALIEKDLKNAKVLDLGCGHGRTNKIFEIKEYCGLDYSEGMLKRARELNRDMTNAVFIKGDGHTIPFDRNSFDVVVCNTVILHMQGDVFISYVKEVHRVLKRGGKFIFNVPKSDYNVERLKEICSDFSKVREMEPVGLDKGFEEYDIIMLAIK